MTNPEKRSLAWSSSRKFRLKPQVSFKEHLDDYCQGSSFHGVKYLREPGRPRNERVFWLVVFICCGVLNVASVYRAYRKWREAPVIVSLAETPTRVTDIPFPAVTICSENKYSASEFPLKDALRMNNYSLAPNIKRKEFEQISLLCNSHNKVDGEKSTSGNEIYKTLDSFRESGKTIIFRCIWRNINLPNCMEAFLKIGTKEGVCFSFNLLFRDYMFWDNVDVLYTKRRLVNDSVHWTLDKGYIADPYTVSYPYRSLPGAKMGLKIIMLAAKDDFDHYCSGTSPGYKVQLHSPADYPTMNNYFKVSRGKSVHLVVKPDVMLSSDTLIEYSTDVRKCFLYHEKKLSLFRNYTTENCKTECLVNYTLELCDCVPFYLPRESESTPVCSAGSKQCVQNAFSEIHRKGSYKQERCNCLPTCSSIGYQIQATETKIQAKERKQFIPNINWDRLPSYYLSSLTIQLNEREYLGSVHRELYTIEDFFGVFGGLITLFTGSSLLGLVEVVYHATIRVCNNICVKVTDLEKKKHYVDQFDSQVEDQENNDKEIEVTM